MRKRSRTSHLALSKPPEPTFSHQPAAKQLLRRHEEDDHGLEHLHQVLRHVRSEDVDEEATAEERAEKEGGDEHPRRMVAPEEGDGDPGETVARGEAVVVAVAVAEQ